MGAAPQPAETWPHLSCVRGSSSWKLGQVKSLKSVGVVGAGILGLAVARELTIRFPGIAVTVFEKEDHVAAHQSGHNSGVVHAGVYYQPGSLKATLCRRGAAMTREFCQQHGVRFRELGKLIVAVSQEELAGLAEIESRATRNQVPGIRRLASEEIADVEPCILGAAALHSPHTAVADYVGDVRGAGRGHRRGRRKVLLGRTVTGARETASGVRVQCGSAAHDVDYLIVCAGLQSDHFAATMGRPGDLRIIPFRGEYYELAADARGSRPRHGLPGA